MGRACKVCRAWEAYADVGGAIPPRSDWTPPIRLDSRFYSCEMFMIESRSEKKEDGLRSPLTASLEPLFVRPELRLGRLLVAARAADGQRREDGALEELAAGRHAFDGVLEPCAGQMAISCSKLV